MARVDPERTVYIYGLRPTHDNMVMYVGCSVNPEKRLHHHLNRAREGYSPKALGAWLELCISCGIEVTFTVLDTCKAKHAGEIEMAWASKMRSINPGLLNTQRSSPYCCHIVKDAQLKNLQPATSFVVGETLLHMRRSQTKGSKYEPVPVVVLKASRTNVYVRAAPSKDEKKYWAPRRNLYEPEERHP